VRTVAHQAVVGRRRVVLTCLVCALPWCWVKTRLSPAPGTRERLSGLACPHVLPFLDFMQSDKAAYLLRPYAFSDLYHRLSTRPFLSAVEKVRRTSAQLQPEKYVQALACIMPVGPMTCAVKAAPHSAAAHRSAAEEQVTLRAWRRAAAPVGRARPGRARAHRARRARAQRWLAFQLLAALAQCHERGVCHGDLKCENVLVTSWDWLFLADFATHKPTYLPADNPARARPRPPRHITSSTPCMRSRV
jgi:hypothetical protein